MHWHYFLIAAIMLHMLTGTRADSSKWRWD